MSESGFDSIAQAVLKQKQLMDKLENENRELRRELTELRAGYSIFLEIEGKRFPVKGENVVAQVLPVSYAEPQDFLAFSTPSAPSLSEEPVSPMNERKGSAEVAPALEVPLVEELPVQEKKEPEQEEQPEQEKAPTFLEEIMLDEFAAASTSPMAVWKGVGKKPEPTQIDEEQKAVLRRELMGSFLLE